MEVCKGADADTEPEAAEKRAALKKVISGKGSRREKIGGFIRALYADFADGVFSEEEYLEMKAGYVSELETLDAEIAGLKAEMEGLAPDYPLRGSDLLRKYQHKLLAAAFLYIWASALTDWR